MPDPGRSHPLRGMSHLQQNRPAPNAGIVCGTIDGMDYDLICLDLDGTLVDTAAEIAQAVNQALQAHGLARRPPQEVALLIGAGAHALLLRLLERDRVAAAAVAEVPTTDTVLATFEHRYADIAGTLCGPYPDCAEALSRLRRAGVLLACVTNKELRHARTVLRNTGLEQHFAVVVGGDSYPRKKPHASVLRAVAAGLGVALTRTAHVGDSAIDVLAAHNAGVTAWAVPYGYNGGVPVADSRPDRMFDTLLQMADWVVAPGSRS